MKTRVNFNGLFSEPISIDSRIKQSGIPVTKLFSIYFAITFSYTHKDCDIGIYIQFRTTGKVFDLTRFKAKSKTCKL